MDGWCDTTAPEGRRDDARRGLVAVSLDTEATRLVWLLAEPSKSFDDIDFANASGRAPPALKKRFAANWYCHPTSCEDESLFAKDSTAQVGQSLHR